MKNTYKIAGLLVNMDTYGGTVWRATPYQVEYTDEPDITVESNWQEFQKRFPNCSVPFCEYTSTAIDFYGKIIDFDAMLLHASAVVMDGKAYLFTADSGTGKSTHTALYRRVFGDERVRILNDDKPVIRCEDGAFFAYGTPWSGKTTQQLNLRVPVGGICVLERGEHNEISRLSGRKAVYTLLSQTVRPKERDKMEHLLDLMDRVLTTVPVWVMKCNTEPEAAEVSYAAMSAAGKEG